MQDEQLKPLQEQIDMFKKKVASHDHNFEQDKQRWGFFQKVHLEMQKKLAYIKKKGDIALGFAAATLFKTLGQEDLSNAYLKNTQGPLLELMRGPILDLPQADPTASMQSHQSFNTQEFGKRETEETQQKVPEKEKRKGKAPIKKIAKGKKRMKHDLNEDAFAMVLRTERE